MPNFIERFNLIKIELINIFLTYVLLYFFDVKNIYIRLFICFGFWTMTIYLIYKTIKYR